MGDGQGTGKQTEAGSVSWSSLDDYAADIAARWNTLIDLLDHYQLDALPAPRVVGWRDLAACRGTCHPCFFPEDGRKAVPGKRSLKQATKWCDNCPVTAECLSYAIRHNIRLGVWGGKTYKERRQR